MSENDDWRIMEAAISKRLQELLDAPRRIPYSDEGIKSIADAVRKRIADFVGEEPTVEFVAYDSEEQKVTVRCSVPAHLAHLLLDPEDVGKATTIESMLGPFPELHDEDDE